MAEAADDALGYQTASSVDLDKEDNVDELVDAAFDNDPLVTKAVLPARAAAAAAALLTVLVGCVEYSIGGILNGGMLLGMVLNGGIMTPAHRPSAGLCPSYGRHIFCLPAAGQKTSPLI